MVYCILFAAAFMFFILDRKIRFSAIPGIAVTFLAWTVLVRFAYDTSYTSSMNFSSHSYSLQRIFISISYLAPAVLIFCFALLSSVVLSALGRNIGKLVFDNAKDIDKSNKTAKLLFIISSAVSGIASILFVISNSLRFTTSGKTRVGIDRFVRFYGNPQKPAAKMNIYNTAFITLAILSVAFIILVFVLKDNFRKILPGDPNAQKTNAKSKLLIPGIVLVCTGNICIWCSALINSTRWKHLVLYNSGSTGFFTTIALILNLTGIIFIIITLNKMASAKQSKTPVPLLLISSVLIIGAVVDQFLVTADLIRFLVRFLPSLRFSTNGFTWVYRIYPTLLMYSSIILLILLIVGCIIFFKKMISASAKKEV